jgi:hypothetical protein
MEWGWNPDTVIAFATIGAMVAAALAAIYAAKSFREMQKQAREAEQQTAHARQQAEAATEQLEWARIDREREHAESVAAWTEYEGDELRVIVQNQSSAPIYDVRLASCLGTKAQPEYYYAARKPQVPPSSANNYVIEPAPATKSNLAEWVKRHPRNRQPAVDIIFFDQFGVQWRRKETGRLERFDSTADFPHNWVKGDGKPLASA